MNSVNNQIEKLAKALEGIESLKQPEWIMNVKSGSSRERLPQQENFWYLRLASMLRTIYLKGPIGTNTLRGKYGKRTDHLVRRSHYRKAGGKIIRLGLQKLEGAKLVTKDKNKGRIATPAGVSLITKTLKE
ncbi:30S ribosomal protein S19e [uncultured archaeon]|nr:30S ribosomal protein S19e [uncultured archaeon]